MARKKLSSNFQFGSTGRNKTDRAITIKVRQNKRTKSVNVRCTKNTPTEACQVAERLTAKAMESIADAQESDEARKRAVKAAEARAATKARRKASPKAPF